MREGINGEEISKIESSTTEEQEVENRFEWFCEKMGDLIFDIKVARLYYLKHGSFLSQINKVILSIIIILSAFGIIFPSNIFNVLILSVSVLLVIFNTVEKSVDFLSIGQNYNQLLKKAEYYYTDITEEKVKEIQNEMYDNYKLPFSLKTLLNICYNEILEEVKDDIKEEHNYKDYYIEISSIRTFLAHLI